VEGSENLSDEDRELIMNLSPAYERWREETLREGRRETVENFLRVRFGSLDEELSGAIAPMLQLPPEELTRLLLTLSREELLEQFGGQ
jgi:predicted hydrocarbon binding protein